jgi:hypothetical protein
LVLKSCSLGCASTGCAVNQIAPNQDIVLEFNHKIDPLSVSPATFEIQEIPSGVAPAGTYIVQGKRVTFRPLIAFTPEPAFGFEPNASYLIRVPAAPDSPVLQSTSGSANRTSLQCTVTASQPVIDPQPGPPLVETFLQMVPGDIGSLVPAEGATCVPVAVPDPANPGDLVPVPIVMFFDDIMDPSSLVQGTASPTVSVNVTAFNPVSGTQEVLAVLPGTYTLSFDFQNLLTRLIFVPSVFFPGTGPDGGTDCANPLPQARRMEVRFSPAITDLSGNALANPGVVSFSTVPTAGMPFTVTESFDSQVNEDDSRSGAVWGGGELSPGKGGGRALLGDLVVDTADVTLDTTSASFPASQTLTGQVEPVTNGVFQFGRVFVGMNRRLRFTGSVPVRLFASGEIEIQGTLDIGGGDAPDHFGRNDAALAGFPQSPLGGLGGAPGPAAGAGGKGGDMPMAPNCPPGPEIDGVSGEGVGGVGGFPQGGGQGSLHYPSNLPCIADLPGEICPAQVICLSEQRAMGGGGGGFRTDGIMGMPGGFVFQPACTAVIPNLPPAGSSGLGGPMNPVDPSLDPETGNLKGGSGGGGSGAHPKDSKGITIFPIGCNGDTVPATTVVYQTGAGGGGGGGAGQFQAGRLLNVQNGVLDARGGDGGSSTDAVGAQGIGQVSGGGAGSGGAILLQSGATLALTGSSLVDVRGGFGGTNQTGAAGGSGGAGYVRIEADPQPAPAPLSAFVQPMIPLGTLTTGLFNPANNPPEADFSSGVSNFFFVSNPMALLVSFQSYELKVRFLSGTEITYSDDPAIGPLPALGIDPVTIYFQGEAADAMNVPIPGSETFWVTEVSDLNASPVRLVRFVINFDRDLVQSLGFDAVLEVKFNLLTE